MGFEVPETLYVLQFEQYAGIEVKCKAVAIGVLLSVAEQAELLKAGGASSFNDVKELLQVFLDSLDSWNLDRKGVAIPANKEGFLGLEMKFAMDILGAWSDAMGGDVDDPLEQGSTNGLQSAERSIKMETL